MKLPLGFQRNAEADDVIEAQILRVKQKASGREGALGVKGDATPAKPRVHSAHLERYDHPHLSEG